MSSTKAGVQALYVRGHYSLWGTFWLVCSRDIRQVSTSIGRALLVRILGATPIQSLAVSWGGGAVVPGSLIVDMLVRNWNSGRERGSEEMSEGLWVEKE